MGRVVHFEIHADDPARAVDFYTGVFGWTVQAMPGMEYWLLITGSDGEAGINGAVLPRMGERPAAGAPVMGACVTISVDELDDTLARAMAAGATMALDKMAVPGVGDLAYVIDTEGNVLGVLQPVEVAAGS
jgi:predicted enzyme related to lactoylglutathione lyase